MAHHTRPACRMQKNHIGRQPISAYCPTGGNKKVMSQIKSQMHVRRNIDEESNSQSHRSRDLEEGLEHPKFIRYELGLMLSVIT